MNVDLCDEIRDGKGRKKKGGHVKEERRRGEGNKFRKKSEKASSNPFPVGVVIPL